MLTHYTNAMRKYAILRGRASRAEFWSFYFIYMVALVAVVLFDQQYFGNLREDSSIIALLFGAVHALPGIAVQVRRLHDIDRSGWWILVNITGIGLFIMLIVAMLPGTQGPNRFGPEPGDPENDDEPLARRVAPDRREPDASFDWRVEAPTAAHSAPLAASRGPADLIGDLERIARLRESGGLSDSEFEVMKAQILSRHPQL